MVTIIIDSGFGHVAQIKTQHEGCIAAIFFLTKLPILFRPVVSCTVERAHFLVGQNICFFAIV
jgi:hypothetical protein